MFIQPLANLLVFRGGPQKGRLTRAQQLPLLKGLTVGLQAAAEPAWGWGNTDLPTSAPAAQQTVSIYPVPITVSQNQPLFHRILSGLPVTRHS